MPTGSFAVNQVFTVNSHRQLSLLPKTMVLLNLLHLECEIPSFTLEGIVEKISVHFRHVVSTGTAGSKSEVLVADSSLRKWS